ncbi:MULTISPECIES: hypothetical protein [Planktothricoides]|uniref:Uncharacterized protein n=1 Tax=Planktothricoides raciborskii FACHB-1370 TaxID=2949576 RepID=A0ABR8EBW0_9CYAN|nr:MULTISPECIES: hypothetical protein [Planktothricoides]MBD2544248.1 hypothetical protein [Planktothricoides raciborskii FACHB-1370]MBD2583600.1 hypothetical protein [Planktothricoides raciborskii FACHB-1261]
MPPTNNFHRNPVSCPWGFLSLGGEKQGEVRNRVSLNNLCHQPTTFIETRFLVPGVSCPWSTKGYQLG